jgi:hypothetical protein
MVMADGDTGGASEAMVLREAEEVSGEETGAVPMELVERGERDLAMGVRDLMRAGRLTEAELHRHMRRHMEQAHHRAYDQGYRNGYRKGFLRGHERGRHHHGHHPPHLMHPDHGIRWGRSRRMEEFRYDIIDRYSRIHGHKIIETLGFYYGTIQVGFTVEGTATDAAFVVSVPPTGTSPVIDTAFDLAIGDTSTGWFGGPHILNDADTNLQNPGTNLFADELFIIEAIQARPRGVRIQYPTPGPFVPTPTGNILGMLSGQDMIWDEAGRVIPAEMFNTFNDTCRLARAIGEVATLHFTWTDKQIGGGQQLLDVLIDNFIHVPGFSEAGLKRTSGGGHTLDLPSGYIWCLDKQFQASRDQGGNGLFDAQLNLAETVTFPFSPIALFGSPSPVLPTGMAFFWSIRLFGTALLPGKRIYREEEARRTRL